MNRILTSLLVAVLVSVGAAGVALGSPDATTSEVAQTTLLEKIVTQPLGPCFGGECSTTECGLGDHAVPDGSSTQAVSGAHAHTHGCQSGGCAMHESCNLAGIPLTEVWKEYGHVASAAISSFLDKYKGVVRLHPSGEAIQFLDCGGKVVAHIPLDAVQIAAAGGWVNHTLVD